MMMFKKNIEQNRLLKLYKAVSQEESKSFKSKGLINFLLSEFTELDVHLNSFYITGPYPESGWKTRVGFEKAIERNSFKDIMHLLISDKDKRLYLSFQNWSHNRTIDVNSDTIVLELMLNEKLLTEKELISLTNRLFSVFQFEYGYIFNQHKSYSINEGKIRKGILFSNEKRNITYEKWSRYESSIRFGYIRRIYRNNFLSETQINNEKLRKVIDEIGEIHKHKGYYQWILSKDEVEIVMTKLKQTTLLVENDEFNETKVFAEINEEIKKYAPQHSGARTSGRYVKNKLIQQ